MKIAVHKKIALISGNALRQVLISASGIAIPVMVVHYNGKLAWGAFVSPLLFTFLALQVAGWGNKEYLIRKFSASPKNIRHDYSQLLIMRLPLLFIAALIALLTFSPAQSFLILFWLLGRYLAHSSEALVIYEKRFNASAVTEVLAFGIFVAGFLSLKSNMSLTLLVALYSMYQIIRGLGYFILFRSFFTHANISIEWNYLNDAFPFFVLSILGFLASKVDVYIIERFGNKIMTADYQIINSLLVFTMSVSAFIYAPFTKNIYRNQAAALQKTKRILAFSGLLIVPAALAVMHFVLQMYLELSMPLVFYAIAFLYVYPSFVYGIDIVQLFREHNERKVVGFLFIGSAFNAALSALFLYLGQGINGALTGSAIAQLAIMMIVKFYRLEK